jgi:TRAP-type C4-dicarboxylate transport system permease small subunit
MALATYATLIRRAVEPVIAAIYVALVAVVVAQVFFRYVLNDSLTWSEEFVRYAMLWSVLLGAGLVSAKREHVNVDFLREQLSGAARRRLDFANAALVLIFCALLVWHGIAFANRAWFAVSPAGGYPMMVVYAAMPLGGVLIAVFTVFSLFREADEERDRVAAAESEGL